MTDKPHWLHKELPPQIQRALWAIIAGIYALKIWMS